jgi:protein-disulfide isomerase
VPAPQPSSSRRSPLLPLYVLLAVVAIVGGLFIWRQVSRKTTSPEANVPLAMNTLTPQQLNSTPGISVGSASAPVTIFEFADFQCPHCAVFATMVEPVLKQRMVETGKVRLVFYDFPLGGAFRWSFLAARGGRCANEQGKFWPFHDYVFGKQSDWSYENDQEAVIGHLVDYATQAGLDAGKFEGCLRSDKYRQEVSQSRAFGELLQVNGTPTLFINGKRVPSAPEKYADIEPLITAELAGTSAAPAVVAPAGAPAAPADSARK